jgi:hypothetical protein
MEITVQTSASNSEPQTAKADEVLRSMMRRRLLLWTDTEINARRHKLSSSQRPIPATVPVPSCPSRMNPRAWTAAWVWNGLQNFHVTVFRCKIGLILLVVWLEDRVAVWSHILSLDVRCRSESTGLLKTKIDATVRHRCRH